MRITKRSVGLFFASFFVSALVIVFCALFIIAERNTQRTGFNKRSKPLEISFTENEASLFVNGRQYRGSLLPVFAVLESGIAHAGTLVWFFV